MNISFPTRWLRYSLVAASLSAIAPPGGFAQQGSPYKPFNTSANVVVYDTISGLNLNVVKSNPLAQHGDVAITLISSGGAGVPHVHQIAYTPDPGFVGVDTFAVELTYVNSWPYLSYQAFRVSVFPTALFAQGDAAISNGGAAVAIPVLANDSSPAGLLTVTEIPLVVNGTATISGGNQIIFTPTPSYVGTAHLNYVVCDGQNHCKTAQANIGVNNGAPAVTDTLNIVTPKNTSLAIPLIYSGYTLFQAPANGMVTLPGGLSFRYSPNANFSGTDQFVLSKNVNGTSVYKTVRIAVANTPGQNRMAVPDITYTPKNQPITFNVRANDIGGLTVKSWTSPSASAGTISGTNAAGNVTFTPNPAFNGVASFSYKIGNAFVPDLEVTTVNVLVGNLSPSQSVFEMNTPVGTPFVVNYQIPIGSFNFTLTDTPDHGTCTIYPGYTTQVIQGESISGNNLIVYTPNTGFTGTDDFKVNYCVTANGQCETVKIQVNTVEVATAPGPYCVGDCVWTGDANNDGIVNNKDLLPLGYLMGMEGAARNNAGQEWYGQQAANWSNPFTNSLVDLKFADTDGDGVVTSADTASIHLFYGQTHQLTPKVPALSKGLPFVLKMLTPPNPGPGDLVQIQVSLGTPAKPVINLYGFTFDLMLGPEIVDSAFQMTYYDNTWINRNSPSLWISKNPTVRKLETAFTRTSGLSSSGHGIIGRCDFIITDIVDVGKTGKASTAVSRVQAQSPTLLWGDGSITVAEGMTLDIPLGLTRPEVPATVVSDQDLFVYPSPATGSVQVHLNGTDAMQAITLYDAMGRAVWQCNTPQPEHHFIDVSNLPPGVYVLQVRTGTGVVSKKIEVLRQR